MNIRRGFNFLGHQTKKEIAEYYGWIKLHVASNNQQDITMLADGSNLLWPKIMRKGDGSDLLWHQTRICRESRACASSFPPGLPAWPASCRCLTAHRFVAACWTNSFDCHRRKTLVKSSRVNKKNVLVLLIIIPHFFFF